MIITIKLHNDLLLTIKNYEEQLEFAKDTKKSLEKLLNVRKPSDIKAMSYDKIGSNGSRDDTTVDRLYHTYVYTLKRIECYSELLEGLKAQVDKVRTDLAKLEGLQSKVYKMHVIEGLTLQQISDELYISKRQVERVNSSIGKILSGDR